MASVFIEANRKGIVYAVASEPAAPVCDPKDWGAAIVPSGSMKGKTLGSVGKPALTKLYQHYLDILGLQRAALVAVAGMTWHDYWIERDDFEIDIARQRAIDFQACLFSDQRPEWDGSESTYEAIRFMHPLIDETEVEIDSLHYLVNAQAKYDEAAEELRLIKSQVMDIMGKAKYAYMEVDGEKIRIASRQAKGNGLPYLVVKKGKK